MVLVDFAFGSVCVLKTRWTMTGRKALSCPRENNGPEGVGLLVNSASPWDPAFPRRSKTSAGLALCSTIKAAFPANAIKINRSAKAARRNMATGRCNHLFIALYQQRSQYPHSNHRPSITTHSRILPEREHLVILRFDKSKLLLRKDFPCAMQPGTYLAAQVL